VIPKRIREAMNIEVGQKFEIILYENRIEFIPVRSAKELRGFLKGIDTTIIREEDRL
jgi:AbrB family looped-hinge helix DNA binding protein